MRPFSSRGRASNGSGSKASPLLAAYWEHQKAEVLGSLEALLTHPMGFGLTTATPLQRQICRLLDGAANLDPDEPTIREAAGDVRELVGIRPREVTMVASVRSAKTMIAAAHAIRSTQTANLDGMGPGEIGRYPIMSLDLDLADVAHQHIVGTIQASPVLRNLLVGPPSADTVQLWHPSGRVCEIVTVAGKRAGASLIARWVIGAFIDEAPRMAAEGDAVVNFDESRRVLLGRLRPGATFVAGGSPWAPFGPIFDQVNARWKRPTRDLVVIRAPGWRMNPAYWTPQRIEDLKRADPDAYRVDCAAEFAAPESALIAPDVLTHATRERGDLEPDPMRSYVAAMDAGTRGNAWTFAIVSRHGDKRRVDVVRQWVGSKNAPLSATDTLREISELARRYNVATVWCDQWSADPLAELAVQVGLVLLPRMTPAKARWEQGQALRNELLEGKLEMHPDPVLREDLLRVRRTVTAQGARLDLPTAGDGRHCDYVPAVLLALAQYVPDRRTPAIERGTAAWYEAEAAALEAEDDAEIERDKRAPRRW